MCFTFCRKVGVAEQLVTGSFQQAVKVGRAELTPHDLF
jgi:hypothetical protein